MFEIGQKLTKGNYTKAAVWCNANGAHIEEQNGAYVIVQNAPLPEATAEEKVAALEKQTGLTRAVRELIISNPLIVVSAHVREKTLEMEELARELRTAEETPEVETDGDAAEIAPEANMSEDTEW